MPSSRTGFAVVTINDDYRGLYSVVERKDQEFLDRWYDDPTGSVFEGVRTEMHHGLCAPGSSDSWACWEMDHVGDNDSIAVLDRLNEAYTEPFDFLPTMAAFFDLDGFVNGLAGEMVVGHWDSYSGNGNNTHIYYEPAADRWHMSPWSMDLAFSRPVGSNCNQVGLYKSNYRYGRLGALCQDDPICDQALDARADEILTLMEGLDMPTITADAVALLQPHVEQEPGTSVASWQGHVQCALDYMAGRRNQLGY